MDSNITDESGNRRREEALARRLGEALDRAASGGSELCPDAELIAAYHERALGSAEIALCDAHFTACSRCRKILAVLAASSDTPLAEKEVARLGELVAGGRAPRTADSAIPIPRWRTTRWLAPALGVAAVLALWIAMRTSPRDMGPGPSETLIAQVPKNEPLPPVASSRQDELPKTPATKSESPKPSADALAKKGLDVGRATKEPATNAPVAQAALESGKQESAELNSPVAEAPLPATPPAATTVRRPLAQMQAGAAGQSATATAEAPMAQAAEGATGNASADSKQASAGQRGVSDLPASGRMFQSLATLQTPGQTSVQIRTPSGSVLWRAGKGGHIERSTNAGNAWILQTSPSKEDWLAGAAVSDTVCWLVGRGGSIARTTDGEHWEEIAPPSLSADVSGKLPDWINVSASSAQTATITAGDQRRYSTQDGGKTWQLQLG